MVFPGCVADSHPTALLHTAVPTYWECQGPEGVDLMVETGGLRRGTAPWGLSWPARAWVSASLQGGGSLGVGSLRGWEGFSSAQCWSQPQYSCPLLPLKGWDSLPELTPSVGTPNSCSDPEDQV